MSTKKPLKTPHAKLVTDVEKLLQKHNFSGKIMVKPFAEGDPCPPGQVQKVVTHQTANGTIVSQLMCVDEG